MENIKMNEKVKPDTPSLKKYLLYEHYKKIIAGESMKHKEYQERIRKLAAALGV